MQALKDKPAIKTDWIKPLLLSIWPIPAGMLFVFFYSRDPALTEMGYSSSFYPMITNATTFIGRFLPASVTELFFGSTAMFVIVMALRFALNLRSAKRKERGRMLFDAALLVLKAVSFTYLGFALLCAPNYHRQPFAYHSGHEVRPSTADELKELCMILAKRTNQTRQSVFQNEQGNVLLTANSIYEVASEALGVMKELSGIYPVLGGVTPQPKPVAMSFILSKLGLSGFYFPYFSEANVNTHMPAFEIPFTMLHELAHAQGFMREDEANFIAYLACRDANNPDFAYSANIMALRYCMNALYRDDADAYSAVLEQLSEDVKRDMAFSSNYWRSFEGGLSDVSEAVNNAYLKANSQSMGTKSYGMVVDLLLAEYRNWPEAVS